MRGLGTAKLMGLVVMAAVVSGCAAKELPPGYKSLSGHSYAGNVILAAGASRSLDTEGGRLKTVDGSDIPFATAGGIIGALSPSTIFGMSALAEGMLTFGMMASSGPKAPERGSKVFAWMPLEMAADASVAKEIYKKILFEAMQTALSEVNLPDGLRVVPTGERSFPIRGESECATRKDRCGYNFYEPELPDLSNAPDFVNVDGPVWAFTFREHSASGLNGLSYQSGRDIKARFPDLEVYVRMSKHLPAWAYIYLAPPSSFNLISAEDQNGILKWLAGPVLLNQGKQFIFITP